MKGIKELFNSEWQVKAYLKEYKLDDVNLKIIKELKPNSSVLALGCGGGREVRALLKEGHEVVAIDFAPNMIQQSKQLAPEAKYFCIDAVEFGREADFRFDYILGLHSFLNYIDKNDRKEFIDNLRRMLNPEGEMIFEIRLWTERFIDSVKTLLSWPCTKEFGDTYSRNGLGGYTISHQFTKGQIRKLFKEYNYDMNKNIIRVKK